MEYRYIEAKNVLMLNKLFELHYYDKSWRSTETTIKKWNWRKFRYLYYLLIYRKEPKDIIDIVNNKSEINNILAIFTYTSLNGNQFKREIYYSKPSEKMELYEKFIQDIKNNSYQNL